MKKIVFPVVIAVPIILSGVMYVLNPDKDGLSQIVKQEQVLIAKGYNSVPVYEPSPTYQEPSSSDSKMEIEMSSHEILQANTEGLIGTNNPFNPRFITEEDVHASISRILAEEEILIEVFDKDYLGYVTNLRHLEMTDKVSETNSKVLEVAKEYKEKIADGKN